MSVRKKRKTDHGGISQSVSNINAELELEIKIKQRLATTLESRITWATALQEALTKEQDKGVTYSAFKYAALDALSALEEPLDILCDYEPTAPPNIQLQQARLSRPPPKPKPPLFRNKASFLYIKPSAIDFVPPGGGSHVNAYLLKCPICARTTFTSLQGLLNHARISHSLEWGTHDECVRACAVVDPSIDVDAGIEVGLGSGGILPGLRSIFQMAMGSQSQIKHDHRTHNANSEHVLDASSIGNFLSRTLGVHEDMPALAPFLGKEPIRRGIKVWNPEEEVNIDPSPIETNDKSPNRWRMRFFHRNKAYTAASPTRKPPIHDAKSGCVSNLEVEATNQKDTAPLCSPALSSSRFHFTARVSVTDRSLSLPKDIQGRYTHKWMISVESPSYSQNITTVLEGIAVTCFPEYETEVITGYNANEPPFVSVGFANKPFLARVELLFNSVAGTVSDCQHQRAIIEHWVELDPLNMCSAVVGEEQVVDIELDKRTIISSQRMGYVPVGSKVLWDVADHRVLWESGNGELEQLQKIKASVAPAYEKVLSTLVHRFPLAQDMKGGKPTNVPYKLVSSAKEFNNLIIGRRKAIQWGRAKALQEAYSQMAADGSHHGLITLSTADIYAWLVEKGHYPREIDPHSMAAAVLVGTETETGSSKEEISKERWCRVCGLGLRAHTAVSTVKQEERAGGLYSEIKVEEKHIPSTNLFDHECIIVPKELHIMKLPPMDIRRMSTNAPHVLTRGLYVGTQYSNQELVNVADPRLTLGVRNVVRRLNLPYFRRGRILDNPQVQYPVDELGAHRSEIESELGPHALLAIITKQLVGKLVKGGLEVTKRDGIAGSSYFGGRRNKSKREDGVKVLTPVHILSSILSRGLGRTHQQDEADKAIMWCLSRVGVLIDSEEKSINLEQTPGLKDDEVERVKVEE